MYCSFVWYGNIVYFTISQENKMPTIERGMNTFTRNTDVFDEQYYINNKRMLSFIGHWPYQSVFEKTIRIIIVEGLAFSLLIPQMLKLLVSWGHIDIFVETFSPAVTNIGLSIKAASMVCNRKKIRKLLDMTRESWECIQHPPEMNILIKYGEKGRRLTLIYCAMINSVMAAYIFIPLVPGLMDYFMPLNQSRPRLAFIQTDYKVDPDEYFYYIYFHGSFVCLVAMQTYVAHDTFYMSLAQHACALFEIMRFRLENIIREDEKGDLLLTPVQRDEIHYKKVTECIKSHKRTIEYTKLMESSCEWNLCAIVILNMLVMSCTASRVVAKDTATQDVIRFASFTIAQVVHLFCNSMPGQWVINASALVRDSAYNCTWYLMSVRSRRLILLLIRQGIKPCSIAAGKMYVMSLENFGAVLRTSMSYLAMLTSMQ